MTEGQKRTLFVVLTPFFLWTVFHFSSVLEVWGQAPTLLKQHLSGIFTADTNLRIAVLRGNGGSSLFYNKAGVLVNEFFTMLSNLSPRLYFQAGDGTNLSSVGVEPVPAFLFVFFVFGLLEHLRKGKAKLILAVFVFSFLAFLIGSKSFAFLFPIGVAYLLLTRDYISSLRYSRAIYTLAFVYSIFLIGRMIWIS